MTFLQLIFIKDIRPGSKLFLIFGKDLFIYDLFRLCWVFVIRAGFPVWVSGAYLWVQCSALIVLASLTVQHRL